VWLLAAIACWSGVGSAQTSTQRPLGQSLLDRALPGTPQATSGQPQLQLPRRAPITLTPSIGIAEEYNDNVFQNNDRKVWDLVTTITPGIQFTAEQQTWRFDVGYDFDARLYARDPDRNNGFGRQFFFLDSFYRVTPEFTVSLDDQLTYDSGINAFSPQGIVSTGRNTSWTNTLRPGVTWDLNRLTTTRAFAAWTVDRFSGPGLRDIDTYRADVALDRTLTPRLRGTVGYQFAYFDIEAAPETTTHTPRAGLTYEFTPTLSASLTGGPTFEIRDGDTRVTPAIDASVRKRFGWGLASLRYNRSVGTAGALGGTTDNQTYSAGVAIGTLLRGLTIEIAPQYRTSESPDDNSIDSRVLTVPIRAVYQLTPYFGLMAGYAHLRQRSDGTLRNPTTGELIARDVDQNRVFVGILVGYPITFD
jgi:hypothetical protein